MRQHASFFILILNSFFQDDELITKNQEIAYQDDLEAKKRHPENDKIN